jgi:hypothetical protein
VCIDCGVLYCSNCSDACSICNEGVCVNCSSLCEGCERLPVCETCNTDERTRCTICHTGQFCPDCLTHIDTCFCCNVTKVNVLDQEWFCADCSEFFVPIYCEECKEHSEEYLKRIYAGECCYVSRRHNKGLKKVFSGFTAAIQTARYERLTEEMHPDKWIPKVREDEEYMKRWTVALYRPPKQPHHSC